MGSFRIRVLRVPLKGSVKGSGFRGVRVSGSFRISGVRGLGFLGFRALGFRVLGFRGSWFRV